MRNLAQYPVNNEDRLQVLKELREKYRAEQAATPPEDLLMGDMTGVVLDDLIEMIASQNGNESLGDSDG